MLATHVLAAQPVATTSFVQAPVPASRDPQLQASLEVIALQPGGEDFLGFLEQLRATGGLTTEDLKPVVTRMADSGRGHEALFDIARQHRACGDGDRVRFAWVEMKRLACHQRITECGYDHDPAGTARLARSLFDLEQIGVFARQVVQRAPAGLSPPEWKIRQSLEKALDISLDLDSRLTRPLPQSSLPLSAGAVKQAHLHVMQARKSGFAKWLKTHWPVMADAAPAPAPAPATLAGALIRPGAAPADASTHRGGSRH